MLALLRPLFVLCCMLVMHKVCKCNSGQMRLDSVPANRQSAYPQSQQPTLSVKRASRLAAKLQNLALSRFEGPVGVSVPSNFGLMTVYL